MKLRLWPKGPLSIYYTHEWFAWRPVFVDGRLVWLETVRRRCGLDGWYYELLRDEPTS